MRTEECYTFSEVYGYDEDLNICVFYMRNECITGSQNIFPTKEECENMCIKNV